MNERPGAPQRTKRHGQILSSTCFPSRLCILKHERGASSLSRSWDNCHTSLTEENLLHVNIHRLAVLSCPVLLDFIHRGDGLGSHGSHFFHLLTTFVQLLVFINPRRLPSTGQTSGSQSGVWTSHSCGSLDLLSDSSALCSSCGSGPSMRIIRESVRIT